MQLPGAVVVVTGASSGIGLATAIALQARGASVVAVGRGPVALAAAVADRPGSSWVVADIRRPEHADLVVAAALERHGRLDAVVAAAGVGWKGPVAAMAPERIVELVEVDLLAPVLLARAALPHLLDAGAGAVVLLTSIAGLLVVPDESVYSAAKAALEAFADGLREELHASGVTVSTVAPAAVRTPFFARRGQPYDRRFPRPLAAERVAAAVVAAVEGAGGRSVLPRWLAVPARLRQHAPTAYRALARRFG